MAAIPDKEIKSAEEVADSLNGSTERLLERFRRMEREDSAHSPFLGMGVVMRSISNALARSNRPLNDFVIISGMPGSENPSQKLKIDSFQITKGRSIPFATGMSLANPKLKVIVLGTEKDLFSMGGSHFIQAARRNPDMTVICLNNYNYALFEDIHSSDKNPFVTNEIAGSQFNAMFNLANLAEMAGAIYVARWTALHFRRITDAILSTFDKNGFSFVEVLAPFPNVEIQKEEIKSTERLRRFYETSHLQKEIDTRAVEIGKEENLSVGKFVERERNTWLEALIDQLKTKFGDKYSPYEG